MRARSIRRWASNWVEQMPRGTFYPLAGLFLAMVSTFGLIVVRSESRSQALASDLMLQPETYVYVALSTTLTMTLCGRWMGLLVDQLRVLSTKDALTRLFNRRYFDLRFASEIARARRYGTHLSLLLIDLDRLKTIN